MTSGATENVAIELAVLKKTHILAPKSYL